MPCSIILPPRVPAGDRRSILWPLQFQRLALPTKHKKKFPTPLRSVVSPVFSCQSYSWLNTRLSLHKRQRVWIPICEFGKHIEFQRLPIFLLLGGYRRLFSSHPTLQAQLVVFFGPLSWASRFNKKPRRRLTSIVGDRLPNVQTRGVSSVWPCGA